MKGNETINYRGGIVQQIEFSVIKNVFLTRKNSYKCIIITKYMTSVEETVQILTITANFQYINVCMQFHF